MDARPPWPRPDWLAVEPFPFAAARSAFAGMTSEEGRLLLRYYRTPGGGLAAVARFGPRSEGAPGLVHGGAVLTALDEALGAAAWVAGAPCLTVRLETEFRRGVPLDALCLVSARLLGERHGLLELAGELLDAEGGVLARARGRFKRLAPETFSRLFGGPGGAPGEKS